ncbi:MAG TPA: anti-sigma factor [Burkholderiales bacterium]|nr:anti-sigma factor [Burkholderiales bacterium]
MSHPIDEVSELDLQAYADGKLPEERRAAVAAWLAAHPDDAERMESYRRMSEELRSTYEGVLDEPVPERLRRTLPPARMRRVAMIALWVGLGAALGGIAGWNLHSTQTLPIAAADPADLMARRAAVAHATYSPEVRHPVEVGADQEAHLVKWLSKRLGTQLRAPQLESVGYSLVGGRLLPGESGPVAHFMYQCNRGTRVTLYVRGDMGSNRSTAFRYAREGSVGVFYWVDSKMGYALSSGDISKEDLLNVANAAYQQLNPP